MMACVSVHPAHALVPANCVTPRGCSVQALCGWRRAASRTALQFYSIAPTTGRCATRCFENFELNPNFYFFLWYVYSFDFEGNTKEFEVEYLYEVVAHARRGLAHVVPWSRVGWWDLEKVRHSRAQ